MEEGSMTFNEYITRCNLLLGFGNLRAGQVYVNTLYYVRPDLYSKIVVRQGNDPFYAADSDTDSLNAFLDAVDANWNQEN